VSYYLKIIAELFVAERRFSMRSSQLMGIALKAGEIMLTSGAEIYRVEETIVRISNSYNVPCESFVLPTGIFISIRDEDGNMHTSFKRIRKRRVDLHRIDRVNSLSRKLQETQLEYDEVYRTLAEIEAGRQHPVLVRVIAAAAGSFVFTLLFNGSYYEGAAALLIGLTAYLLRELLSSKGFFQFLEIFSVGLVAGLMSIMAVRFFPQMNEYKIIIGSIMLHLPGVSITNGIKDALYGDLVASLTRLGEALLLVTVLAAGVAIALTLGIEWR